jgi:hypothetical protein
VLHDLMLERGAAVMQASDEWIQGKVLSVSADTWTSTANTSYLAIFVHGLDGWTHFTKLHRLLELPEAHTGENLAGLLQEAIEGLEVDSLVTDNAANMKKAVEIMQKRHVRCAAHTLQLAVMQGLKIAPITAVLTKCRNVVTYYRLAKGSIVTPATTVACERFFSLAGWVLCQRRSRLSADSVRALLVLHGGWDDQDDDEE